MAYFSLNKLPKKERIRLIGEFYSGMGMIKNRDEAAVIFRDILDGDEIGNIMRRIDIAILLLLNFTYEEIVELLEVGRSKISRVHRALEKGGEGYRILLARLLEHRKKRKMKNVKGEARRKRSHANPDVSAIKKRYPGHFLLWNIMDEFGDTLEAKASIKSPQEEMREYYRKNK